MMLPVIWRMGQLFVTRDSLVLSLGYPTLKLGLPLVQNGSVLPVPTITLTVLARLVMMVETLTMMVS
jgi:hypothetical protein